jgi:signal transduction histidine kinase
MKINFRPYVMAFAVSLLPILAFIICLLCFRAGYLVSIFLAVVAAAFTTFFAARNILSGLVLPMVKVSSAVKCFITADYKLESVIPREGWPEAGNLISSLNRLMLELSAYRAFHLNQVVEERAKAQALIETISDSVMLVDDRGQLIYSNERALKLLGIPKLDPHIVLPGSVRQTAFFHVLDGIMSSQEKHIKADVAIPGQDEDCCVVRNFRVISHQFFLATFKRSGRVILIRDVTVEKEIESSRETFFHMITHDMRAPLTSIQGYAELMEQYVQVAPESGKYLQAILRSSKRLNGMVDDILNTIKLEHGEMKLCLAAIDAGELCVRVFEVHDPLAARKNIKFSIIPASLKVTFTGDIILLERVISNLVGNSLKFTPKGGTVSLSFREAAGKVVFFVEDSGPGIPKEKYKEIFEKYTQLEEHQYMGFGLGLAMCKMAVELHNGHIWVESEEGKGSKFSFAIPIK